MTPRDGRRTSSTSEPKSVTLEDVARAAKVSISTVSRAISQPGRVGEKTRQRVLQVIDEMGYVPSRVARRLRMDRGHANLIGLVLPDIQNPFFADLARGVEDVAQKHGYAVFLGNSDEDPRKEQHYLEAMRAESVDGVIVPPISERDEAVAQLSRSGVPVVCVDRRLSIVDTDTVVVDNVRGAYKATDHLIQLGHRRIGFIEGRPEISTSRERMEGYRRALEEHELPFERALVREGDSRQASGARLARELLTVSERPTALLVGNNLMTLGALEASHALGLRIPEELAIVGYDDMPWALALNPPLTAVRQPGYEVGQRAMELLLERINNPTRSNTLVLLQPQLVVRRSCGVELRQNRRRRA